MVMKMVGNALIASAIAATATASVPLIATAPPPVEIPVVNFEEEPTWKCPDCSPEEKYVLEQIQEKTKITDRNALATILGNIKQESMFHPDICEGGARVPYDSCHSGGYGLIQWTTEKRYLGLGSFCKKYNCDPSSLEGQTQYMINENQFQAVLPEFEGRGYSIDQYMVPAYYWLGWGIKGNRENYSYNYSKQLIRA
jgi:hypothetical protein|tara:strand:+ start:1025 stop:1615 length:591 start_codon:yes stop_codon:yes gene_type:complete